MGMSAEQFFQVVLLPQGQFAQLPARQRAGQGGAAAEAVRHRPVPRGRELAGRPPPVDREGSGRQGRGPQRARRPGRPGGRRGRPRGGAATPAQDPGQWVDRPGREGRGSAGSGRRSRRRRAAPTWRRALAVKSEAEQLAGRQRRRRDALRRQQELQNAAPQIAAAAGRGRRGRCAPPQVKADLDAADRAATAAAKAHKAEARARASIADLPESGTVGLPGDATVETLRARRRGAARPISAGLTGCARVARQAATRTRTRPPPAPAPPRWTRSWPRSRPRRRPRSRRGRRRSSARDGGQPGRRRAALQRRLGADAARQVATDAAALVKERAKRDRLHRGAPGRPRGGGRGARGGPGRPRGAHRRHARRAGRHDDRWQPLPGLRLPRSPRPVEPTFEAVSREPEDAANALADQATAEADKAGQDVAAADGRIGELAQRLRQAGSPRSRSPRGRRPTRPTLPRAMRRRAAWSAARPAPPPILPRARPPSRPIRPACPPPPGRPTPTRSASKPRPRGWRRARQPCPPGNASLTSSTTRSPRARPGWPS